LLFYLALVFLLIISISISFSILEDCVAANDCDSLLMPLELSTEDGKFERHEKTVAIVGGNAVFQNAKGY